MYFKFHSSYLLLLLLFIFGSVFGRIHRLDIRNDDRRYIALSTFGFLKGGLLSVNLTNFKAKPFDESDVFGFTLDRTRSDAMNPYLDSHQERCLLQGLTNPKADPDQKKNKVVYFTMDFKKLVLKVNCSSNIHSLRIYKDTSMLPVIRAKRDSLSARFSDTALFPRKKRNVSAHDAGKSVDADQSTGFESGTVCSQIKLPMTMEVIDGEKYYNVSFVIFVPSKEEEGLYNLYFHSCPNYKPNMQVALDFTMQIAEENNGNYLSAGQMPLPALYFMMALLFFLSGCFWVFILKKSNELLCFRQPVFKTHYLMAILVYLKSLSLLFHGINFHFIQTKGEHVAAWAILYYITHFFKGAVLFITIVLIGTGWTFIKHILAEKDKKLFMIVIPLQVLANVAKIIVEESEEGDVEHKMWKDVFTLVDLLCCGAIVLPVIWSIRHLQEAEHTDGKAAINLRELKLFRQFYFMILCYIYFTRIIVYLLKKTVPFQYEWLHEMFREMATYVFFVLIGYKFRPAAANPYFTLATEELEAEDDEETDVVLFSSVSGGSGMTEGLSKVSKVSKVSRPTTSEVSSNPEDKDILLFGKKESSHEYD